MFSPLLVLDAHAFGEPEKLLQCGVSQYDNIILRNFTGVDGHTVTIGCKHFANTSDFRFAMYYDNFLLIGECPFIQGVNHWQINFVDGKISSTHWSSTSTTGDTRQWIYSFN